MSRTVGRPRWRRWLRRSGWVALAAFVGASAWGVGWEPRQLVERDYALALPHWPAACDGVRLDVVADLHVGSPNNGLDNLDRVIDHLLASDSDAVLMAGDYVILSVFAGTYVGPEPIAERLRRLTARKRVYGVLGNHDWWKRGDQIARTLSAAGVVMLEDASAQLRVDGCTFAIAGVGDLWEGRPDIARAYAAVPAQLPVVALSHNPAVLRRLPAGTALLVAGHTHGGQVQLPILGRPTLWNSPDGRYAAGHMVERGRHVFVSPGIGTSIFPVRFGVPPEISRLTLQAQATPPLRAGVR